MLKIVICDDLKEDRERAKMLVDSYLEEKNLAAEVHVFDHPDTMLQECEKIRPQIYILDIVMPMVSGIEAARELRWDQKESQIIFTTSEPSFALESFDVNPVNYLLKPIQKDKLFDTLDLAIKHVSLDEEKSLSIKVKGGYSTVFLSELMYIDYRNHVVTYHLVNGDEISTTTLRIGFVEYLKQNIEMDTIVQCHESYAVNIAAIDKLTKNEIITRNKEMVPVSKSKYAAVSEAYLDYRFN